MMIRIAKATVLLLLCAVLPMSLSAYGNASSGIVNVLTTEGTSEFHGSLEHRMYLPLQMFWVKNDSYRTKNAAPTSPRAIRVRAEAEMITASTTVRISIIRFASL